LLPSLVPNAKYVHLRRRDRRGQAISWYRAKVTNEWWRIHGVSDPTLTGRAPEFHAPEIRRMEIQLERQQREWDEFFADNAIESITMDYESLAANYRDEVARVLRLIGEDAALAQNLPNPRLAVQADATTEEWRRKMDVLFPVPG
jgi:LPS sulfotransferase NodH